MTYQQWHEEGYSQMIERATDQQLKSYVGLIGGWSRDEMEAKAAQNMFLEMCSGTTSHFAKIEPQKVYEAALKASRRVKESNIA